MELVAEPKNGEAEDDFRPDAHALFFAPQEFAHVPNKPQVPSPPPSAPAPAYLSQPMESHVSRDGLLSPYCSNGPFFTSSHGSVSSASSPVPSSACSTRAVSPYYPPMPTPGTENMTNQVFQLNLNPPSPAINNIHPSFQNDHATPVAPVMAPLPPQYTIPTIEESGSNVPTPKISPSKLGHRRAASKGLSLSIPPNTFANGKVQSSLGLAPEQQESGSNPTTPWPQMLVCLFVNEVVAERMLTIFSPVAHSSQSTSRTLPHVFTYPEGSSPASLGTRYRRLEQGFSSSRAQL